ncbi:hypothetical protein EX30DRAFT_189900 [Ascodesmis nigricans]|uniref:Uncharacterized protein n=1 Tax=Ascodesmis nigricans TaxID=341454 RepID=A0A4S2N0K9_9PEZI|nr:hypothetical protein EX30DRAFT_189900 [Ascodesmis nigricans]
MRYHTVPPWGLSVNWASKRGCPEAQSPSCISLCVASPNILLPHPPHTPFRPLINRPSPPPHSKTRYEPGPFRCGSSISLLSPSR